MVSYYGTIKILILGEASVDKTSFIKRYCYNLFNPSERLTIGVDFHVKTIELNDKRLKLQLWDVGGEERHRFLLPTYCLGANAAFLLYDVTRSQTLDNITEWTNIVRQKSGDIPIMLVGILPDKKNDREVAEEEGKKMANSMKLSGYIECNIHTKKNVNEAFEALTRLTLAQPQLCHKCQKEFTFGEFLNHPCYTTGDVLSTGAVNVTGIIMRIFEQNRIIKEHGFSKENECVSDSASSELISISSIIDNLVSNIQKNPSKKKIYLRIFLDRFSDLSDQDKIDIIKLTEDKADDDDVRYPYPYVFKPPSPPDDFEMAPQIQVRSSSKKKDTEIEINCQYCGRKLTKDEQLTHSCKKKPKNS